MNGPLSVKHGHSGLLSLGAQGVVGRLPMEPFLVTLQGPLVPISRY